MEMLAARQHDIYKSSCDLTRERLSSSSSSSPSSSESESSNDNDVNQEDGAVGALTNDDDWTDETWERHYFSVNQGSNNNCERKQLKKPAKISRYEKLVDNLNARILQLQAENKQLIVAQHKEDILITRYQSLNAQKPVLLQRAVDDTDRLRDLIDSTVKKTVMTEKKIEEVVAAIEQTKLIGGHMKSVISGQHLVERKHLSERLDSVLAEIDNKDNKIINLERHIRNLTVNHSKEFDTAAADNRQACGTVRELKKELKRYELQLLEKEKEVELTKQFQLLPNKFKPKLLFQIPEEKPAAKKIVLKAKFDSGIKIDPNKFSAGDNKPILSEQGEKENPARKEINPKTPLKQIMSAGGDIKNKPKKAAIFPNKEDAKKITQKDTVGIKFNNSNRNIKEHINATVFNRDNVQKITCKDSSLETNIAVEHPVLVNLVRAMESRQAMKKQFQDVNCSQNNSCTAKGIALEDESPYYEYTEALLKNNSADMMNNIENTLNGNIIDLAEFFHESVNGEKMDKINIRDRYSLEDVKKENLTTVVCSADEKPTDGVKFNKTLSDDLSTNEVILAAKLLAEKPVEKMKPASFLLNKKKTDIISDAQLSWDTLSSTTLLPKVSFDEVPFSSFKATNVEQNSNSAANVSTIRAKPNSVAKALFDDRAVDQEKAVSVESRLTDNFKEATNTSPHCNLAAEATDINISLGGMNKKEPMMTKETFMEGRLVDKVKVIKISQDVKTEDVKVRKIRVDNKFEIFDDKKPADDEIKVMEDSLKMDAEDVDKLSVTKLALEKTTIASLKNYSEGAATKARPILAPLDTREVQNTSFKPDSQDPEAAKVIEAAVDKTKCGNLILLKQDSQGASKVKLRQTALDKTEVENTQLKQDSQDLGNVNLTDSALDKMKIENTSFKRNSQGPDTVKLPKTAFHKIKAENTQLKHDSQAANQVKVKKVEKTSLKNKPEGANKVRVKKVEKTSLKNKPDGANNVKVKEVQKKFLKNNAKGANKVKVKKVEKTSLKNKPEGANKVKVKEVQKNSLKNKAEGANKVKVKKVEKTSLKNKPEGANKGKVTKATLNKTEVDNNIVKNDSQGTDKRKVSKPELNTTKIGKDPAKQFTAEVKFGKVKLEKNHDVNVDGAEFVEENVEFSKGDNATTKDRTVNGSSATSSENESE